jgi:Ca2+-binding EF-hand superfamily protein
MSQNEQDPNNSMSKAEIEEKYKYQQDKIRLAFKEIDRNGDDIIDEDELTEFMTSRSKDIKIDVLQKLFKTLDFDNNKQISM